MKITFDGKQETCGVHSIQNKWKKILNQTPKRKKLQLHAGGVWKGIYYVGVNSYITIRTDK